MKRIANLFLLVGSFFLISSLALSNFPKLESPVNAQPQAIQPVSDLIQLGDRFEAVAKKVSPSVVYVEAIKPFSSATASKSKSVEESGSGVIIKVEPQPGFLVLTNNHVISQAKPGQIT